MKRISNVEVNALHQETLAKNVDQKLIKRRKEDAEKAEKDEAKKDSEKKTAKRWQKLLNFFVDNNITITTCSTYKNTRPQSRLSSLQTPKRSISVDDSVDMVMHGMLKNCVSIELTDRCI
jgi:hypothetical protein